MEEELDLEIHGREKARNVLSFFCFGLLSIFYHETLVIAVNDSVAAQASVTTTATVLAVGAPQLLIAVVLPWIIQKIPPIFKILTIFLLYASGLLIVVFGGDPTVRLVGIALAEAGKSMAEVTFISSTAFYGEVTISAFVAGTGIGAVLGPLYYTATTAWFCVAPRIAITVIIPGLLLLLVVYAMLDRSPLREPWAKASTHEGIKYEQLAAADESWDHKMTCSSRVTIGWLVSPLIIFLYWGFFADYLSNRAAITSMAFKNAPFGSRQHYNYYTLCDRAGEVLGRSYLLILAYTCSSQLKRVQINKTWILALVSMGHTIFFVTMSWYRIIPQVGLIMALCFTQGFTTGALYLNSPHVARDQISIKNSREFGLAMLILGNVAGQLAGGLLGTFTDPALEEHCLYALKLKTLCHTSFKKGNGWNKNRLCKP